MCGLAGVFNLNGKPVTTQLLKKMGKAIAHRGPDGDGLFVNGNIGLVHQRLAIIDTSDKGAQPMLSRDGRYVLVFNGCIYNFPDLRQKLRAKGHSFHSNSDTEVIVEGISAFGISFVEKLNGMFAIACWDKQEKKLYFSRDRFGIKPLYYWFNGQSIVFGSEIKAILQHPDYQVGVDLGALNEYFTFQNIFTFRTLFQNVNMLPPANTVVIDANTKSVKHQSWWDYNFTQPDGQMTFEEAKLETERLMEQAVARQMIADVPVGSYLSGGMDSGTITSIASRYVPRISTFTCGFDMSEVTGVEANYDERRDAELMANAFKTEHFEQVMNAGDLKWSLPRLVYHLEDLRVGMSYPNYYIARLASKFVKVCLQGTGGDELFGGYPWRYYRIFDSSSKQNFYDQYYSFWQRLVPDSQKTALFQSQIHSQMDLEEPRRVFERVFTFNKSLNYDSPEAHIQNSLYFEAKTFLPGLFLVGDKLAMASGLEERFPFMDNDLVNFVQKIPIKYKLGNLSSEIKRIDENSSMKRGRYRYFDDGKKVLREAMKDYIPQRITERKKQGFSAPDESWYRGENASYVKELLLNPNETVSTEFIRPEFIKKIVREHMDQRINHRLLIWSMMNFEWWCRIFLKGNQI